MRWWVGQEEFFKTTCEIIVAASYSIFQSCSKKPPSFVDLWPCWHMLSYWHSQRHRAFFDWYQETALKLGGGVTKIIGGMLCANFVRLYQLHVSESEAVRRNLWSWFTTRNDSQCTFTRHDLVTDSRKCDDRCHLWCHGRQQLSQWSGNKFSFLAMKRSGTYVTWSATGKENNTQERNCNINKILFQSFLNIFQPFSRLCVRQCNVSSCFILY